MPGPSVDWRRIGELYVETTPLGLKLAPVGIVLTREQALELRDFLNQQYPVASVSRSEVNS